MSNQPLDQAIDPQQSASVSASAGTGKTYLLISRIVRLLLDGARPDGILAITFTRKAANEMQARLRQRLADYASADKQSLKDELSAIGVSPTPEMMRKARGLYEHLLMHERSLRALTFHAFCQDILGRFPLEADVPPGFELLESDTQLRQEALETLLLDISQQPATAPLRQHLDNLLRLVGTVGSVRTALSNFLLQRQDWLAYIEGHDEPLAAAAAKLREQLDYQDDEAIEALFTEILNSPSLEQAHVVLAEIKSFAVAVPCQPDLAAFADATLPPAQRLQALARLCSTKAGACRRASFLPGPFTKLLDKQRKLESKEWALALIAQYAPIHDARRRQDTYHLTVAWQALGHALLDVYQRLKKARRCLDFADLEWLTYGLLKDEESTRWVQYKVDQRIDHLLIDEFQDTNPTQWQLVLPLLQELAIASDDQRRRTVFLVGDEKQSIYGFRRADSRLLGQASQWLVDNVAAAQVELSMSYRSAPLIMKLLNRVFLHSDAARIGHFPVHETKHESLWGRLEILPLAEDPPAPEWTHNRNPLLEPTPDFASANRAEAAQIVDRIEAMVRAKTMVGRDNPRPMQYGDVLILLRNRTGAAPIEEALRARGIPYLGTEQGTLLESLEITDVLALFAVLVDPSDNLALAQLLKSPIGRCSDAHLTRISALGGSWFAQLQELDLDDDEDEPLRLARDNILLWHELADVLPAHDLLDRIYSDVNIMERYQQAYPPALQARSRANLERFINLMLEIDSGRYPSLRKILEHLLTLRDAARDAPDNANLRTAEPRVRVMTMHGAKGLEAPVVFLADMHSKSGGGRAWEVLTDWAAAAAGQPARPKYFILAPPKNRLDSVSEELIEARAAANAREEKNLLYVALSRPQQVLVVSGTAQKSGTVPTWYEVLREAAVYLAGVTAAEPSDTTGTDIVVVESGEPTVADAAAQMDFEMPLTPLIEAHLGEPAAMPEVVNDEVELNHEERLRGLVVHWFLETDLAPAAAARQFALAASDARLWQWWEEAEALKQAPELAPWLGLLPGQQVLKEIPLSYVSKSGKVVSGVIDRLVLSDSEVLISDYKTHRRENETAIEAAEEYRQQLLIYAAGLRRMYPQHKVRMAILFTAPPEVVEL